MNSGAIDSAEPLEDLTPTKNRPDATLGKNLWNYGWRHRGESQFIRHSQDREVTVAINNSARRQKELSVSVTLATAATFVLRRDNATFKAARVFGLVQEIPIYLRALDQNFIVLSEDTFFARSLFRYYKVKRTIEDLTTVDLVALKLENKTLSLVMKDFDCTDAATAAAIINDITDSMISLADWCEYITLHSNSPVVDKITLKSIFNISTAVLFAAVLYVVFAYFHYTPISDQIVYDMLPVAVALGICSTPFAMLLCFRRMRALDYFAPLMLVFFLMGTFLTFGSAVLGNGVLDTTVPESKRYLVVDRVGVTNNREARGHRPVPSHQLMLRSLSPEEDDIFVFTTPSAYSKAKEFKTQVQVLIHEGSFGYPWYSYYYLIPHSSVVRVSLEKY